MVLTIMRKTTFPYMERVQTAPGCQMVSPCYRAILSLCHIERKGVSGNIMFEIFGRFDMFDIFDTGWFM